MRKETLEFLVNSYCQLPAKSRPLIVNDLLINGVESDWIQDVIHFNYNPLSGDRPTIMTAIGRGIDELPAFSRVDKASIELGFNGPVDYPDLCNVYVESAQCRFSNEELPEDVLDELSDDHELKMSVLN